MNIKEKQKKPELNSIRAVNSILKDCHGMVHDSREIL